MQYSGKPGSSIYRHSTRKKRLSLPLLLAMLVPLLLVLAVGVIFISNAVTHAAANDNAPVASNKSANVAANTVNSNIANSGTNDTVNANTPHSNANPANTSANTANSNTNTANTNTANNMPANNATNGVTNGQVQQANCAVNGAMIKGCNGTVTIKLMNGTTAMCSLVQSTNIVALNCPASQNNQNTNIKAQQFTCTVNGAEVKGCNGLATITTSNDATTCSLATANNTVTLTCPAVQPQAKPQNGQPAQQIQQPPHQKW